MFCKKCGNEIANGARFCNYCGNPVELNSAETTVLGQETPPVNLANGETTVLGNQQANVIEQPQPQQTYVNKPPVKTGMPKGAIIAIVIVATIVVIGIAGAVLFSLLGSGSSNTGGNSLIVDGGDSLSQYEVDEATWKNAFSKENYNDKTLNNFTGKSYEFYNGQYYEKYWYIGYDKMRFPALQGYQPMWIYETDGQVIWSGYDYEYEKWYSTVLSDDIDTFKKEIIIENDLICLLFLTKLSDEFNSFEYDSTANMYVASDITLGDTNEQGEYDSMTFDSIGIEFSDGKITRITCECNGDRIEVSNIGSTTVTIPDEVLDADVISPQ